MVVQAATASPARLHSEANHAGSAGLSFVVSTVTGQQFSVIAAGTDSVVAIKRHILQQAGIPIAAQRIVRAGVELEDTQTLSDCGVADKESLHLTLKLTAEEARAGEGIDPALADMMQRHGLTEAEQRHLHGEGVVDLETFASLRDEDFQVSGIDIHVRRQEKLQRDQEKAAATHALATMRQVQDLLDDAGLSHAGRECARSLSDVSTLRALETAIGFLHNSRGDGDRLKDMLLQAYLADVLMMEDDLSSLIGKVAAKTVELRHILSLVVEKPDDDPDLVRSPERQRMAQRALAEGDNAFRIAAKLAVDPYTEAREKARTRLMVYVYGTLEEKGLEIADGISRILAGERNEENLTMDTDDIDTECLLKVLQYVTMLEQGQA
eukprot:COSAG06_NODE_7580_length_2453_cov_1.214528_4_plen_380_part_01